MPLKKLPQIKMCLCCCKLRTGALIIGWASLIAYAIAASGLVMLIMVQQKVVEPDDINFFERGSGITGEHMTRIISMTVSYSVLASIWMFSSITSIILLVGVYRENKSAILLWFKIVVVMYLITVAWAYADLSILWDLPVVYMFKIAEFCTRFFLYGIHIALYFYFMVVVKSYYFEELEDD